MPSDPAERVQLGHGGGGGLSQRLIEELFVPAFGPADGVLHDAATLAAGPGALAFTTDSYVVRPLVFPGGDIGRLAVIGTVNDLAMVGACPLALSLALILEEGLAMAMLRHIVAAIRTVAAECGVPVVTGDTKVVERGKGDGIFITTSAVGRLGPGPAIGPPAVQLGDAILVSGDLGRHGVAILAARQELGFRTDLQSDLASLLPAVQALLAEGLAVHALRDLTRGGLASALTEIARGVGLELRIQEAAVPIAPLWPVPAPYWALTRWPWPTKAASSCSYPPPRRSKPVPCFRPSSPKPRSSARWPLPVALWAASCCWRTPTGCFGG